MSQGGYSIWYGTGLPALGDSMDGARCGGGTDRCCRPQLHEVRRPPVCPHLVGPLASKASLLEPRSTKGLLGYSTETPRKGVRGAGWAWSYFPECSSPTEAWQGSPRGPKDSGGCYQVLGMGTDKVGTSTGADPNQPSTGASQGGWLAFDSHCKDDIGGVTR